MADTKQSLRVGLKKGALERQRGPARITHSTAGAAWGIESDGARTPACSLCVAGYPVEKRPADKTRPSRRKGVRCGCARCQLRCVHDHANSHGFVRVCGLIYRASTSA